LLPTLRMVSAEPALMRLRLALMLAYSPVAIIFLI
jgi:hypothetical protein